MFCGEVVLNATACVTAMVAMDMELMLFVASTAQAQVDASDQVAALVARMLSDLAIPVGLAIPLVARKLSDLIIAVSRAANDGVVNSKILCRTE